MLRRTANLGRYAYAYRGLIHNQRLALTVRPRILTTQYAVRFLATDRSKVENTLKMLREEAQKQHDEAQLKLVPGEKGEVKKLTIKEKVVAELKHYYHGFRLLALETRLSTKYLWKIVKGQTLTRRERQQLVRTVADLLRLVPFSVFVIVPFMELALPVFIKLFPNMLPSTFQEASKEQEKIRKQLKLKVEMAKFLQDTIEEIALEKKKGLTGEKDKAESKALEFAQFIKKVRREGGYVSNEELLKFSKLFEDELTLDNLGMSQLRSLCRLMSIQPLGSPEILRFQLNMKLRELKADDKMIASEGGVDKLSTIDLQSACRERGMRSVGLSEERLREQLRQWLELSLNDKVPPAFLLLSRTLYLPEDISFTDRLKMMIQSLPEGIAEQTRQRLTELEGGKVDYKARLDLIKMIEDGIQKEKTMAEAKRKEEEKLKKENEELEKAAAKAEAKALKKEKKAAEMEELKVEEAVKDKAPVMEEGVEEKAKISPPLAEHILSAAKDADQAVKAVKEVISEAVEQAKDKEHKEEEKMEKLKVGSKDLSSIEELIVGGPIHEAKHDIIGLKEKVIEHTEDLIEINALDGAFAETKVAKRLRNKLNSMIENVDTLVSKLEEEKRTIQETVSDPALPEQAQTKHDKTVRIQDIIDSLEKLKSDSKDEERKERITHLLKVMDKDEDGIVDKDIVLEVIALLEKHSDVEVSASQVAWMVGTLQKEDKVETLTQKLENAQAGQFDLPPIPSGPSSAEAFVLEGRDEAKNEDENGESKSNVELPKIDEKVTTILGQQKTNGTSSNSQTNSSPDAKKPK